VFPTCQKSHSVSRHDSEQAHQARVTGSRYRYFVSFAVSFSRSLLVVERERSHGFSGSHKIAFMAAGAAKIPCVFPPRCASVQPTAAPRIETLQKPNTNRRLHGLCRADSATHVCPWCLLKWAFTLISPTAHFLCTVEATKRCFRSDYGRARPRSPLGESIEPPERKVSGSSCRDPRTPALANALMRGTARLKGGTNRLPSSGWRRLQAHSHAVQ
jgi:hypothetical protein